MNTYIDLLLTKDKKISIIVPNVSSKINYFYVPTEKLHKFDEVTINFIDRSISIEMYKNTLDEFIIVLHSLLKRALKYKLLLPDRIEVGEVGKMLNYLLNNEGTYNLDPFWVCSSVKKNVTLIYNINKNIYLEIAPMYPWTYVEPKPGEYYISFDEFMKNYKPYIVEIIPHYVALEWQKKCEEILKLIE